MEFGGCKFTRILRKCNCLTDQMANFGVAHSANRVFLHFSELPKEAKGFLRVDMLGWPSSRK